MLFVTARGLNKSYAVAGRSLHVLRDLDLAVERGEMVAIVGASGVGKSTLLHVLGGLDRPDGGDVMVGDVNVGAVGDAELVAFRNRHVGFVFQFHHLLPEFSAIENAEMPLRIAGRPAAETAGGANSALATSATRTRTDPRPRADRAMIDVPSGSRRTRSGA